jgi:nucleotide-binding universal stress UspA family protein
VSGTAIAVLTGWVGIGAATALLMWRRGHDALSWLVMGLVFGPAAPLFAMEAWHRRGAADVVAPGRRGTSGGVDVLVGVDGSPRSGRIVREAVALLGPRLGRLTVAWVVPHDAGTDTERLAAETLRTVAAPRVDVRLEVLHGRPAQALLERAAEGGYDLVAVGARGAGLGTALVGSTAHELAGTSKVPVLVLGGAEAD